MARTDGDNSTKIELTAALNLLAAVSDTRLAAAATITHAVHHGCPLYYNGVEIKANIAANIRIVPRCDADGNLVVDADGNWLADAVYTGPGIGWAPGAYKWELAADRILKLVASTGTASPPVAGILRIEVASAPATTPPAAASEQPPAGPSNSSPAPQQVPGPDDPPRYSKGWIQWAMKHHPQEQGELDRDYVDRLMQLDSNTWDKKTVQNIMSIEKQR
jgi:hypothetical protein